MNFHYHDLNPFPPSQDAGVAYTNGLAPEVQLSLPDSYDDTIFPHAEFEAGVQRRIESERDMPRSVGSAVGAGWGGQTGTYQPFPDVQPCYSNGNTLPAPQSTRLDTGSHTAPLHIPQVELTPSTSPTLPLSNSNSAPISAILASPSPSDPQAPPPATSPTASATSQPKITKKGPTPRTTYTAEEYLALAGAVCEIKPYAAPAKQIGKRWKLVAEKLKNNGFFKDSNVVTIQNKMKAILEMHEDARTPAGKKLEQVINSSERVRIQIAALLDQIAGDKDGVVKLNDDQKAEKSIKEENNKKGGLAIRDASCMAHVSRKQQLAETDSDSENVDPSPPKAKRVKIKDEGSLEEIQEVRELITVGEKRREKFEEEIIGAMQKSTAAYERIGNTMIDVLREKLN